MPESMEIPRVVYDIYRRVAEKFADMHASPDDDVRRQAHRRGVQTIRAKLKGGVGDENGARWVCKSEHNTGWAAVTKDGLAYVPGEDMPEHGRLMKMHMFDMVNGGSRKVNDWPIHSENFNPGEKFNPEAYVLIEEDKDWLDDEPQKPPVDPGGEEPGNGEPQKPPVTPPTDLSKVEQLLTEIRDEQKKTTEAIDKLRTDVIAAFEKAIPQLLKVLGGFGGLFGSSSGSPKKK